MISVMATAVHRLADQSLSMAEVLDWSCPVPYFGPLTEARIATVGINPSNREFVDATGDELIGLDRRFPTLASLEIEAWGEATSAHLDAIATACESYFAGNPYDRWFGVLDRVLSEVGASYYGDREIAAHLDLVPYATAEKWGTLGSGQQRALLLSGGSVLGAALRDSPVEMLILNGRSVVREFEAIAQMSLSAEARPEWNLPRKNSDPVLGIGYLGIVDTIGETDLGRKVSVVGYNHNLQSSFGVTTQAVLAIAQWIRQVA